ncbi:MAG: hypothetical protein R3D62_00655 [Xanthobacteraceae bacterium]
MMKRLAFGVLALLLVTGSASAATASGSGALALAAIVAGYSPSVTARERGAMNRLFAGRLNFSYPANRTISIKADAIVCRAGNVDITAWSCELTFGKKKKKLKGRRAHELYAAIAEAGVPPDGAAGSSFEALSHLDCSINPDVIKQKAGGGATCNFDPGQP